MPPSLGWGLDSLVISALEEPQQRLCGRDPCDVKGRSPSTEPGAEEKQQAELIRSFSAAPLGTPQVEDQFGFSWSAPACLTESSRHRFGPAGRMRRVDTDERGSPGACEWFRPPSKWHDLVRDHLHAAAGAGESQARFAGPRRAQDGCAPPAPGEPPGMQQMITAAGL